MIAALVLALSMQAASQAPRAQHRSHVREVPCRAEPATFARVLAFSEDGARALVEERAVGPAHDEELRYAVLGPGGRELEVLVSSAAATLTRTPLRVELVDRDRCRAGARALEKALASFRTVRVHESGCAALPPNRSIVELLRTAPSPLPLGAEELAQLQADTDLAGTYWVSNDGPLVVIVSPAQNDVVGGGVVERVFLRADPRINKRWPDPAP